MLISKYVIKRLTILKNNRKYLKFVANTLFIYYKMLFLILIIFNLLMKNIFLFSYSDKTVETDSVLWHSIDIKVMYRFKIEKEYY